MFKKCLHGLNFRNHRIHLEKHPLNSILHWLVRLIYLPALIFTLYYGDLSSYMLLLITFCFFECFAITRIVSILSDAVNLELDQNLHSMLSPEQTSQSRSSSLPDDWHNKIRSAVAHNQLHCDNCGKVRSGFSIAKYPDNYVCEYCDDQNCL